MSEKALTQFGIPEDEFRKLLIKTVEVYPFARKLGKIIDYETSDDKNNFFYAAKIEEPDLFANFIICTEWDSIKDYLWDKFHDGLDLDHDVDLMEDDVIHFKVKDSEPDFSADVIFAGKFRDLDEEEKNSIVKDFLASMKRISRAVEIMYE